MKIIDVTKQDAHKCKVGFPTRKIDDCSGTGFNICSGTSPMILEIWHMGQNGLEDYCDEWTATEVQYCPFCGLKAGICGENH